MNYKEFNDYELLSYIAESDEQANDLLFQKYRPFIIATAKNYFQKARNQGIDLNDLIQEGMIGFSYAINSFKEHKDASFYTYAKTCVENKIISALVKADRLKHKFLNESLSYENDEGDYNYQNLLVDDSINPEKVVMDHERQQELIESVKKKLTDLEAQVFELKLSGFEYKEIAEMLDKNIKTIDNALQRIKTKIKSQIDQ